jgi:hypothetical protein
VSLRAQDADSASVTVAGFIEVSPRLSRVHGQTSPIVQVAALLGFSSGWRAGGAGFFSLERINLGIPAPLEDLELHLGYGGLVLERSHRVRGGAGGNVGGANFTTRLLLGGGNAEVRDAATAARLRSDNFFVLEPALGFEASLTDWASLGLVAAYRIVIGVDGLLDIDEKNLRGGSIGLSVRLGPF